MLELNNSQQSAVSVLSKRKTLTRRELCHYCSLSWAAVSKTVSQLQDMGLVTKDSIVKSNDRGRHPGKLSLDDKLLLFGAEIRAGCVDSVLTTLHGEITDSDSVEISADDDPVPALIGSLKLLMKRNTGKIIGIGISFHGMIDRNKVVVIKSLHMRGCSSRNLRNEIMAAVGGDIPVIVERNAVCELLYMEKCMGLSRDSILISAASGVSAAVLIDGQILHGKSGNIGELGHVSTPASQIPCKCGRTGCIETMVGALAWERRWRDNCRSNGRPPGKFKAAFADADPLAIRLLLESLNAFFPALYYLATVFRPEEIIFTLDLPPSSSALINSTMEDLLRKMGLAEIPSFEFIFRQDKVSAVGAALTGLHRLSGNPHYTGIPI